MECNDYSDVPASVIGDAKNQFTLKRSPFLALFPALPGACKAIEEICQVLRSISINLSRGVEILYGQANREACNNFRQVFLDSEEPERSPTLGGMNDKLVLIVKSHVRIVPAEGQIARCLA